MHDDPTDLSRREFFRRTARLLAAGSLCAGGGYLALKRLQAGPECLSRVPCHRCGIQTTCSLPGRTSRDLGSMESDND